MPTSRRLLAAVSLSFLAACASRPPGDPPAASLGVPFARTAAAAPGFTNVFPFSAGVDWRLQALYRATDVKGAGNITGLRFVRAADNAAAVTCPGVSVRLGHSTLAALGTTFASNVDASTLATVATGITISIPAGTNGTWFDVPLSVPYEYDGVEGLIVDLETPATCSGTITIGTLNAGSQRLLSTGGDAGAATHEHDRTTGAVDAFPPAAAFLFAGGDDRVLAGVSGGNFFPWANFPRRVQMLQLASDIASGPGPITSVGFEAQTVTTAATYTYTLRLGHTAKTALDPDWESNSTGWVTVATSVTVTFPQGAPAGTWVWVPLTSAFQYDGTSNLVVDVIVTVGDGNNFISTGDRTGARSFGAPGTPTGSVDGTLYHVALRFKGAAVFATRPPFNATWVGVGASSGQLQQLIRPHEMGASGVVTQVAVRAALATTQATVPMKIYLGQTTKTGLSQGGGTYASNMDQSVLAFSGTATIPGGLARGDWIQLPIARGFVYDATKSLVVLLMHDVGTPATNMSMYHVGADATGLGVGRNDNTVDLSGNPTFDANAFVDMRIGVQ